MYLETDYCIYSNGTLALFIIPFPFIKGRKPQTPLPFFPDGKHANADILDPPGESKRKKVFWTAIFFRE